MIGLVPSFLECSLSTSSGEKDIAVFITCLYQDAHCAYKLPIVMAQP